MTEQIDLKNLSQRESEQIEWKENVADLGDVVSTLSAFANDLSNLGGGYVVCGAKEEKDEHGFPKLTRVGLTAPRFKELEGKILALCRDRVSPSIAPIAIELASDHPDKRVLVFIQPATPHSHTFRSDADSGKHYVRVGRSTIEARNGLLRDLLVRKGTLEPWDRRPCPHATVSDIDLLALRDALQRMGVFTSERGIEPYLSENTAISPFVPPLLYREPLTGTLRPRNFSLLLFGRETQRFIPGAFSLFSVYPGMDRSDPHAERYEIAGTLLDQSKRLTELLDIQSYTAFNKNDPSSPNTLKYPKRALYEALSNALAHRDYELGDPTRITVFEDRIEVVSPGSLPLGVDPIAFKEGRTGPKWRNQALAWFFSRLQLAQAEGQGISTILRVMREEGCPPPSLEAGEIRVLCILPAHPRHALLREIRTVESAIALGELAQAQKKILALLERDPLNYRTLQLFAEVQNALEDPGPVFAFIEKNGKSVYALPPNVLVLLSETLLTGLNTPESYRSLAHTLLSTASRGRLEERELRRIAIAMLRAKDNQGALALIDSHLKAHPEWGHNASILQLRGDALLGLAKKCRNTGGKKKLPPPIRQRAWRQFHEYLNLAERELRHAEASSIDSGLTEQIKINLEYLEKLRAENQPRRSPREY